MSRQYIVSGEDSDTSECHTHHYTADHFEGAIDQYRERHPNDTCLNCDYVHCAVGYPEPTD